ncbi:MAG: endonuclease/exonuclease/phosphatase family protein [Myxococcales bacterium]|nr:endonuclease/exonuclease/phosphatase family protein [Myxococcales bacterium]
MSSARLSVLYAEAMAVVASASSEPAPLASPFSSRTDISHNLQPHYAALRLIPSRRKLMKSPLYAQIEPALRSVLSAVETATHAQPAVSQHPPDRLRVVAWNIQRGRRLEALKHALQHDPTLREADVLLLSEVDCGMGRSGNRNVSRELATALRMHYAFGVSYLVLGDDVLENETGEANTLALAGSAILSRFPIGTTKSLDLPELKDKFSSKSEKRLGKKRALAAQLQLPSGDLWVSTCHLDSNASPMQRGMQLRTLLQEVSAHGTQQLVGGDFNTTTYDASGTGALVSDLLHKFFTKGFDATVDGYMTPEHSYEQPIFTVLAECGFLHEGLNDRSQGTYFYDVDSPYEEAKLRQKVGLLATRWLQKRLRPWNGCVPARLDWFVGKNVQPLGAGVVRVPRENGILASDHLPIFVDLQLGAAQVTDGIL